MATYTPNPNITRGPTQASGSTHQFTGSVEITGSLTLNGSAVTGGGGGGISWDGSTANGVATYKDADEATVESNLTFDGSTLAVTGTVNISGSDAVTSGPGPFQVFGASGQHLGGPAIIVRNTSSFGSPDSWQQPVSGALIISDDIGAGGTVSGVAQLYIHSPKNFAVIGFKNEDTLVSGKQSNYLTNISGYGAYMGLQDKDLMVRSHIPAGAINLVVEGGQEVRVAKEGTTIGNNASDYHQITGTLSISGSQPLVVYGPGPGGTGGPTIIARNTSSVGGANMWEQPASGALIVSADTWGTQVNGSVMYVHSNGVASTIGFKNSSTETAGIQGNKVTSENGAFVGLQNADLFLRNEIGNLILTADGSQEIVVDNAGTTIGNHAFDNHRVSGTLHVSGGIMQQQYFSASISSPVNATCSLYNVFNYHLTANSEVTASSPVAGTSYLFFFRQDGTGARTVDFSGFKWPGGTAPTLSTAASAVDIVSGISDGTYIYADTTKNFS